MNMIKASEDCWASEAHQSKKYPSESALRLKPSLPANASLRSITQSEPDLVDNRLPAVSPSSSDRAVDNDCSSQSKPNSISGGNVSCSHREQTQTIRKTATNWYSLPVIQVALLGLNFWLIACTLFIHQIPGAVAVAASSRRNSNPSVFSNQFALNIPAGDAKANEIARKYGYRNLGQIGSLSKFYLFEHSRIQKRSLDISHEHHAALVDDPDVEWFEQQVEKRRVKRDFPYYEGPTSGSSNVGSLGPSYFSTANSFLSPSSSNIFQPTTSFLSSQQPQPYNGFFDPLFKEQWYLVGGSKDGFDMNVQQAWKRGFTGKGVVVSILDDGIQTNHPDLIHNYDPRASTDINDNDNDPTPQDNGDNKHGTRCAGEVAATAGNNICGVGIAYNASIGGVRMLDGTVNDAVEAKALGLNPEHVDIYSASWGPEDDGKTVDGPGPLARRAFIYGVTNGRRGLGSIFVWASGNGGRHVDSCNCDGYTNSIFTLSISSATQGGYKPWYLEECSSTLATTYSSGTPTLDKSVATCDMDGQLRPDHICTVEHTGTSASAPLAAGIAALALEANRNLSWRDLQHIVIMTSRPEPLEKEEGWFMNGVSRKFSHKFGYGLMDAAAVVDLALSWAGTPPQHICKSREIREDREIPGTHLGKVKVFMDVDGCAGTNSEIKYLEHVQCKISLRFFPRGNLRILLTSPMGTTSVLLFERPRDVSSSNFDDWPFLSVHFWGEQAHGRWTLEIVNSGSRRINQPGILKKWQLILYGTDVNPVKVRSRSLTTPQQPGLIFESSSSSIIAAQQSQPSFRNVFQQQHYNLPQEFLFPGASENVAASVQKPQVIRSQCQNDYWIPELAICVNDCPEGYYATNSASNTKVCLPCPSRCRACTNSTSCASCEHNLVLHRQSCLSVCPEGYFEADSSCEPCQLSSCAACAGTMGTECARCKHGLVLHQNQCLVNCPARFYPTSFNECVPCTAGCQSCDEEKCHMCSPGYELSVDEHSCLEANSACPVGLYLNQDTGECHGCGSENCLHCSGPETCIECVSNSYLYNGDCLPQCWPGLFHSLTRNECFVCPKLCTRCESFETCTQCRDDGLLENGKCLPHCSNGFYNDRGNCVPCAPGCKTCVGRGDSECLTCHFGDSGKKGCPIEPSNAIIKETATSPDLSDIGTIITTNRALANLTCPDGYYLHKKLGQCYPCHSTCAKCTDGNPYNCRSCHPPLRLDRGSSRCIECCQNNEDQNCCHCNSKRHAQIVNNPLTRDLSAECHFVSRRVSENDQSTPVLASSVEADARPKWSDSATMLSLFCLSALCVLIAATILMVQRQRSRNRNHLSRSTLENTSDDEFYTNALTHSPKRYYGKMNGHKSKNKALYTPVSLHEEDEEKLLNEESLYSHNQVIHEEEEDDETTTTNSEIDEFERDAPTTSSSTPHFIAFPNGGSSTNTTRSARSIIEGIPRVLKT